MTESICGIYKITSPSGRVYIGQAEKIPTRWRDYFQMNSKTKNQPKVWRSFEKYGVENHIFEVMEYCSIEDLNCKERYWQDFYNVLNGGLNCVLQECGEARRVYSDESKKKRRDNYKAPILSEKRLEELRLSMLGNTLNLGRIRPQEEKDKISKTMIESGMCKKEKNNMWGKSGQDNPNCKLILDLYTGIFYYGIREASLAKGVPYNSLKKIMCGSRINNTSLRYV